MDEIEGDLTDMRELDCRTLGLDRRLKANDDGPEQEARAMPRTASGKPCRVYRLL